MINIFTEDFVCEVSGDVSLGELDRALAQKQQLSMLEAPKDYSINRILLENLGPQNHQSVLGLSVEHQGIITKCGGQVIKNVSGYDLRHLYIGSRGAFGKIVSVYLRSIKLAEHQLSYELSLDLLAEQGLQAKASLKDFLKNWEEYSYHQNKIKLWGDLEILELRSRKLEKYLQDRVPILSKKLERYNKSYPSEGQLEYYYNVPSNPDEERILEKLYAAFASR